MNGREVIKRLQHHGFTVVRMKGSHYLLSDGVRKVTVPVHGASDIKLGTLIH